MWTFLLLNLSCIEIESNADIKRQDLWNKGKKEKKITRRLQDQILSLNMLINIIGQD